VSALADGFRQLDRLHADHVDAGDDLNRGRAIAREMEQVATNFAAILGRAAGVGVLVG